VLHSIPLVEVDGQPEDPTPALLAALGQLPSRIVYLSSTAVYGAQREVDEHTLPAPRSVREKMRVEAEQAVMAGPWSSMVLRPAAIYGPGRGVQVSLPRGSFRLLGDGSNWVSRIHVDDLAALATAALLHAASGAWPAADFEPARSRDVAEFVARLTGCQMPESSPASLLHETRRADRRVDARAVYRLLGLSPRYPSFREGIPASLDLGRLKC
jgi:nucleoside-diphosphate-sugar epimerase